MRFAKVSKVPTIPRAKDKEEQRKCNVYSSVKCDQIFEVECLAILCHCRPSIYLSKWKLRQMRVSKKHWCALQIHLASHYSGWSSFPISLRWPNNYLTPFEKDISNVAKCCCHLEESLCPWRIMITTTFLPSRVLPCHTKSSCKWKKDRVKSVIQYYWTHEHSRLSFLLMERTTRTYLRTIYHFYQA